MERQLTSEVALSNPIIESFIQRLFDEAASKGLSYVDIGITEKEGLHLTAGQGVLEGLTAYNERVAALRGLYQGKMGTTYTEQLQVEEAANLVQALIDSASLNVDCESDSLPAHKCGGRQVFESALSGNAPTDITGKVNNLLVLEAAAVQAAPEVQKTDYCDYHEFHRKRYWFNSMGMDLREWGSVCTAAVSAVAVKGEQVRTAFAAETGAHPDHLAMNLLGREAGSLAAKCLSGGSIASGSYPVVLVNTVAAALLEGFSPVFCADRVLDKLSLLEGKLGQSIASDLVSIVDNPRLEGGARTMHFDDEGTLTKKLDLVVNGVLKSFLHNEKTAEQAALTTTGHGIRSNHKSSIEVQPSNLWIEKGRCSFDKLLMQMDNGVMITDVQGTFAGINAISGEFSLQASGFKVENGKVTDGVHGITISGNFFDLLREVAGVADDLRFGMPYGAFVGSPSLYVPSLTVAGE